MTERWEKKNRGPKDISPEERAARNFVKALKRVYKPVTYSPANPREIYEVIQRPRCVPLDSEG